MKNTSIRFKMTLWFSLILVVIVSITLMAVLQASKLVLRGTIRNYLIGTVEENVDHIQYVEARGDTSANYYLPYSNGYLEIDLDFMKVINDVHTALYSYDGTMLYGENPLPLETSELHFTESQTWHMIVDGIIYDMYDRKLNIDLPVGELWIRGIVPETRSSEQMKEIIHLSLIILPILLLMSVASGYLLAGRLLAPIRDIEQTASHISNGDDLKQRIDVGDNNDEIGRLAKVFNRMLDRLERSFEAERQFTSDASHELRTPTSVILAQCEYILEKERTPEDYAEAFEVVQKQGRRMNALISDMLDYTRMDQSPDRYTFEKVDLSQIVSETAEQMSLLGTKGITMSSHIEDVLYLSGNRLLLSRLVQNLVSNAYRYGKEGGHVELTLSSDDKHITFSVADDGIGIPQEDQEKIFDRFFRSDSSRTVQGTGLGLSMVKRIAELHDAEVNVQSEPDKGSTFTVVFKK